MSGFNQIVAVAVLCYFLRKNVVPKRKGKLLLHSIVCFSVIASANILFRR